MKKNISSIFCMPLFKQSIRSNIVLFIAVLIIMCMMANVTNYAMSIMSTEKKEGISEDTQKNLYTYMFALARYNEFSNSDLSYEGFVSGKHRDEYEKAFNMAGLSADVFEDTVKEVEKSDISYDRYISQFEYAYALSGDKGCFSGDTLSADEIIEVMLECSGISSSDMEKMKNLDFTVFFNKIYFTVIGILPPFIFVIIAACSLIAGQVDKGSMAYILSTPTRRSAVAVTQALYLITAPLLLITITCASRCITTAILFGDVNIKRIVLLYLGMYLVTEAAAGICFLASCIFNIYSKAAGAGGGITVWFFLASLLGMFGSSDLVAMGIGTELLDIFNKLTIVSLFDADAIQTVGTRSCDTGFVYGMVILGAAAVVCYIAGTVKFCKKDLPL